MFTSSIATKERTHVLRKFLACDFVNIKAVTSLKYLENLKKKTNYPFLLINANLQMMYKYLEGKNNVIFFFWRPKYLRGRGSDVSKLLSAQMSLDFGVKWKKIVAIIWIQLTIFERHDIDTGLLQYYNITRVCQQLYSMYSSSSSSAHVIVIYLQ
jgi:hypothetical protein